MAAEQVALLVLGLALIAAVGATVAYTTAALRRPGRATGEQAPDERPWGAMRDHDDLLAADPDLATAAPAGRDADATGGTLAPEWLRGPGAGSSRASPGSVRQMARVVALMFLAASAVVVAVTRAWPATEPAIFILLALGTLLVVLFLDLLPPGMFGRWRRPAEALGAVVFLGVLLALTGGAGSPFIAGLFLVVAGTALSTEGRAPLIIALLAAATVGLVGLVDALDGPVESAAIAWLGFNAVALVLLADVATAAARALRRARDEALRASRFDALTGLYNRGFFFTTMEQEIRRSDRMGRGFTLLMLDLDGLKPVNDRFGHQWGDRLLRAVADTIRRTVRFTDAAARYGGDEFVVLLPETDVAGGYVVAEKLRRDVAALTLQAADRVVRSTVSVGLVAYPDDGTTIEQLVAAADVAMYESKRRGKNRIVGYQTRMERVATAIEVELGETAANRSVGARSTDQAADRPGGDAPGLDVRTGGDPAPWGTATAIPATGIEQPLPRPVRSPRVLAAPETEARPADGPARTDAPPTRPDDPTRTETPTRADPRSRPDAQSQPDGQAQPWLTRMDGQPSPPPQASADQPPAPGRRASADRSATSRPTRRIEELRRSDKLPWIVLPIEPHEPPDRPPG